MRTTSIEWTHHRFNAWAGCAKAHPGCKNCYAEALPPSMRRGARWGEVYAGGERIVAPDGYWANPIAWARSAARAGERHRVFCASVSDVLEVPADAPKSRGAEVFERVKAARLALTDARERLWDLIRNTASECGQARCSACTASDCHRDDGGLDWLLLTKRPENWRLVPEDVRPLVWLGTSVSDQETANEWVPRLLEAEGFGVRFLSVEPLLGPVNLGLMGTVPNNISQAYRPVASMIDWVIVGGESGRKARQCQVEWVRDIVRQCRDAGVPVFVKQLGANVHGALTDAWVVPFETTDPPCGVQRFESLPDGLRVHLGDSKGGDMSEWPEDLRVRELPEVRHA